MKMLFPLSLLMIAGTGLLHAGEAVFSKDGTKIYLISRKGPGVEELNLKSRRRRDVMFDQLQGKPEILGLSRSGSGFILLCNESEAWAWDPKGNTINRICTAAEGEKFRNIAYDFKRRWTVLTTVRTNPDGDDDRSGMVVMRPGAEHPVHVYGRRVGYPAAPEFDHDGQLYFCYEGDIWIGWVQIESGRGVLTAYRCCPIATRETCDGTPAQTGAAGLTCAGGMIYSHVRRMGGSGWGDIVRFKAPVIHDRAAGDMDLLTGLERRVKLYLATLGSIERLAENGGWSDLCVSDDGSLVHYVTYEEKSGDRVHWLIRDNGKPRKVKFSDS